MNPLEWINGKFGEFLALPSDLDRMYESARQVFYAEAQARFDQGGTVQSPREVAAIEAMVQIDRMRREWHGIYGKLVLERRTSFGAVPVALVVVAIRAVTAIIIVLAITAILRKKTAMESIVGDLARLPGVTADDVLEAMRVAPDEQSALDTVVKGVTDLVKWTVVGGIAFLVLPKILRN